MSNPPKKQAELVCGFCGKSAQKVENLVVGPKANICTACARIVHEALQDPYPRTQAQELGLTGPLPSPKNIKAFMDQFVIGQERAKIALAVAVYTHYKRIKHQKFFKQSNVEVEKSNVILIGPSGTGKTLIARTLAKKLRVPFAITDATTLTEAGYVGEDVESILLKLYRVAGNNIKRAEKGIVYIDEIDKIARRGENVSITRDVSGEGVQQALLKIIEGTEATFSPTGGRKHPNQELMRINTTDILFICGGAFVGLDSIVRRRMNQHNVGFVADAQDGAAGGDGTMGGDSVERSGAEGGAGRGARGGARGGAGRDSAKRSGESFLGAGSSYNRGNVMAGIQTEDLINFGIIPEFVGRMPVVVGLDELSRKDLTTIATKPKNAILKQYQALLAAENLELIVEDGAVEAIVDQALQQKIGARGLRAIIEQKMTGILFDIVENSDTPARIILTRESIVNDRPPHIEQLQSSA